MKVKDILKLSAQMVDNQAVIEYLEKGATANYKELLKERNEKLKQAGSEKIVAEVQRQIDEWVKQTR